MQMEEIKDARFTNIDNLYESFVNVFVKLSSRKMDREVVSKAGCRHRR